MKAEARAVRNVLRAEKARRPGLTDLILAERMGGELTLKPLREILKGAREARLSELNLIADAIGIPMETLMSKIIEELEAPDWTQARSTSINDQVERELTQRSSEQSVTKKPEKPRKSQRRDVG